MTYAAALGLSLCIASTLRLQISLVMSVQRAAFSTLVADRGEQRGPHLIERLVGALAAFVEQAVDPHGPGGQVGPDWPDTGRAKRIANAVWGDPEPFGSSLREPQL